MAGPYCLPQSRAQTAKFQRRHGAGQLLGPLAVRCPLHWLISSGLAPQMVMAFAAKMLSATPRKSIAQQVYTKSGGGYSMIFIFFSMFFCVVH